MIIMSAVHHWNHAGACVR